MRILPSSFMVDAEQQQRMKKSLSYFVNVNITKDATVIATQCECGAGTGPQAHEVNSLSHFSQSQKLAWGRPKKI